MRILLVHQNFPGQFRDIAPALCDRSHELKAISCCDRRTDPRIEVLRYQFNSKERNGIHALTGEVDEWITRAELAAQQAKALKDRGWAPDVILAHPGWGEAMVLKQVFPATPLVIWPELWLKPEHLGINEESLAVEQAHYLRVKNWLIDGAMADASRAVLPTLYQAKSFPERWQSKISVIPEGVAEQLFQQSRLESLTINPSMTLGPGKQVVTFISRNLEPMRGFHLFMRALPELQQKLPELEVVIVGGDGVSYSSKPGADKTWKQVLLEELEDKLDMDRIHFFGRIPHQELIKLYRRSDLHVYLSNAFVLSWSLLEVMATGTRVLTADNPMLREIDTELADLHAWDPGRGPLSESILRALNEPPTMEQCRNQQMQKLYGLAACAQKLERLLLETASGSF
jgi:glycosyltransferase involved in cell wall biosynthesis